jgi:ribosomal protein L37AE/L43A
MSKIWDEREKSLEDEYFRRKERELIEKLHAQRAEEEQREKEKTLAVQCPKCEGSLKEVSHEGVSIDRCNKCYGVWLDAGELERLTGQEESHGWLSRMWNTLSNK